MTALWLASKSPARAAMLRNARVEFETVAVDVDEDKLKKQWRANNFTPAEIALKLAEAKALEAADSVMQGLVLGADQTLALDNGDMLDKPLTPDILSKQLHLLSGRRHYLHSAAVIAENGRKIWEAVETVALDMRSLSNDYITTYVDCASEDMMHCVGGYQIEGQGAQLFEEVNGSYFAVLGLPLLPLLKFLRQQRMMGQ